MVPLANINARYSSGKVTSEQRGEFVLSSPDGSYVDGYTPVETVENAHDQQAAPTNLYTAPLDNNITTGVGTAPTADRADEYRAPSRTLPKHDFVPIDTTESLGSDGS